MSQAQISTGGFLERVDSTGQGRESVDQGVNELKQDICTRGFGLTRLSKRSFQAQLPSRGCPSPVEWSRVANGGGGGISSA